jgi:VWFA-related protein
MGVREPGDRNVGSSYDIAMKPKRFLVLAIALFCAGAMSGQAPASPKATSPAKDNTKATQGVVLRSETRLVELNVIVETKKGRLIEDLKKEDFTLLDNGKAQNIALFSTESAKMPGTGSRESDATNVLAPNVFGNRLRHSDEPQGSVNVILFDALNTSFTDQAYARTQILAFLRQLQPQDHVAIYLLTNHLAVINEFTQDSKSLLQAIARFQSFPSLMLANSSQPLMSAQDFGGGDPKAAQRLAGLMNDMNSKLSDVSNVNRVDITAQAIEAIANHVAGIPGRKSLVWISGGFPISISFDSNDNSPVDSQSQNFTPQMERVARALNQSNMAIYPVDARGLLIGGEFEASSSHPFSAHSPPVHNLGEGQSEQSTMDLLANRTGGHAYYNTNDIKGAIRRTLGDSRFTYTIGYYPDHGNWNGEYHTIQLRAKKSGLVMRYRKGYFALADPPEDPAATHYALQAAVWSPVDATSLGIQARIEAIYLATRKLDLRVKVDTGELRFKDVDGQRRGSIDAIYMQLGAGDAVLGIEPLTYKVELSEKDYQSALHTGYELKAPLVIQAATRNLRVVVRDAASGFLGSVTVPLERFLPPQSNGK